MESKTNEAHLFLSSVSGVPNNPPGSIFASRHAPHAQGVTHQTSFNVSGDNYSGSSIRPVTQKRKLSPSPHTMTDRPVDGFSNGSPPKGGIHQSPSKRLCPNNMLPDVRSAAPLPPPPVHNSVINQNSSTQPIQKPVSVSSSEAPLSQQQPSFPPVISETMSSSMAKIDQVIDEVLAKALSDEPHEDIFCIPTRIRDYHPLPSPLNLESTPSSSLHTSSPLSPCSPRLIPPGSGANSLSLTNNMGLANQSFSRSGSFDPIQRHPNNTTQVDMLQRERMRLQNARNSSMQVSCSKPLPQSTVTMLMKPSETVVDQSITNSAPFMQPTKVPLQGGYFEQADMNTSIGPVQQNQQQQQQALHQVCNAPPRQILSKAPLPVTNETKLLPVQQQQQPSDMMQKQHQQQLMQQPNNNQNPNLQPRVLTYISQRPVSDPNSTNVTPLFTFQQQQQQQQARPANISSNPPPTPIAVKKESMIEISNQPHFPPPQQQQQQQAPHGGIISNGLSPSPMIRPQQPIPPPPPHGVTPIHPMVQYPEVSPKPPTPNLGVIPPRKRPPAAKRKKSTTNSSPALISPGIKMSTNVPLGYIRTPLVPSQQGLDFTQQQQHQMQLAPPMTQQRVNPSQEAISKLIYFESKKFLADPDLQAFSSAMPSNGAPAPCPVFPSGGGEESWVGKSGLKYGSGGFSLTALTPSERRSSRVEEIYMHQYMPNIVNRQTIRPPHMRSARLTNGSPTRVCASPEPVTLDNRMKSLLTNFRNAEVVTAKPSNDSTSLLSMLNTPCSPRERPAECKSPHLQLYHIPNFCILKALRKVSADVKETSANITKTSPDSAFKLEKRVIFSLGTASSNNIADSNALVRKLCTELEIDQNNVLVAAGEVAFRSLPDSEYSEEQIREFTNGLRLHFPSVSVRTESIPTTNPTPKLSETNVNGDVSSQMKWLTELQKERADDPNLQSSLGAKYKEESMSAAVISSANEIASEKCQICHNTISPDDSARRIKWEELAASKSISLDTDQDYITVCGEKCLNLLNQFLTCHIPSTSTNASQPLQQQVNTNAAPSETSNTATAQPESRHSQLHLVTRGLTYAFPVLLQQMSHKSLKSQTCGRKSSNPAAASKRKGSPKQKRWQNVLWKLYRADLQNNRRFAPIPTQATAGSNEASGSSRVPYQAIRDREIADMRSCILCGGRGDGTPSTTERLLCLGADRWVHLNCALWCFEIYESVSGSLQNVDENIELALRKRCAHCGRPGAGLPCYNSKCSLVYHVPCALSADCMFFSDRAMYCKLHQPKETNSVRLTSLSVDRRVYATRDESEQVADVLRSENSDYCIRIGSLVLRKLGQLLPHQIESKHFHTRKYIYPVSYSATRIFWSMRRPGERGLYHCKIKEQDGRPLFQVTVVDKGLPDIVLQSSNCTDLWRDIAVKVQLLRKDNSDLIQMFPNIICGEDMFGLSDPNVLRAIESLPGVESLVDHAFHYGKLQLIPNMPLAVNPSGCARCEPSYLTSMRRKRAYANSHESSPKKAVYPHFRSPGRQMSGASSSAAASQSDLSNRNPNEVTGKNHNTLSWCHQYRQLKTSCNGNVVFGRSRIQGFGMFAAEDLDANTIVIEYIGELIRPEVADKREKEYEARNRGIYMFRLEDDIVIDATMCGGPARYINHSCDPNCFAKYVNFDNEGHIVIITKRKVEKGEELTYDYLFDFEDQTSRIPCLCGATNCRKWMN